MFWYTQTHEGFRHTFVEVLKSCGIDVPELKTLKGQSGWFYMMW